MFVVAQDGSVVNLSLACYVGVSATNTGAKIEARFPCTSRTGDPMLVWLFYNKDPAEVEKRMSELRNAMAYQEVLITDVFAPVHLS